MRTRTDVWPALEEKPVMLCKKKNYVKWWNNKYFKLLENHFFPLLVKILYLVFNLTCLLGERDCKAPWDYCKTGKHRTVFEVSTSSFMRDFLYHYSVIFKGRKIILCQMIYRWNYFYLQKCAFLKWISLIFPLHLPFEYNSCPLQLDLLLVWQVAWEQFLSSSHYLLSPHWFLLKATELPQQLLKTDAQIIKYLTSYTN